MHQSLSVSKKFCFANIPSLPCAKGGAERMRGGGIVKETVTNSHQLLAEPEPFCRTIPQSRLRRASSLEVNWSKAKRGWPGPLHKGAFMRSLNPDRPRPNPPPGSGRGHRTGSPGWKGWKGHPPFIPHNFYILILPYSPLPYKGIFIFLTREREKILPSCKIFTVVL